MRADECRLSARTVVIERSFQRGFRGKYGSYKNRRLDGHDYRAHGADEFFAAFEKRDVYQNGWY